MDFLLPRTFSDFLFIWPVLFLVFVPGFYLLGRLLWAVGLDPLAKASWPRWNAYSRPSCGRPGNI